MVYWRELAMTLAISTSLQLELLNPTEHASTARDQITVIGRTNADSVHVSLNGRLVRAMAIQDSVFHARLQLPYGFNTVVVAARDIHANEILKNIEILRGPKVKAQMALVYADYRFHDENPRAACFECHDPAPPQLASGKDGARCATCHAAITVRVKAHAPNDSRSCTNCHVFEEDLTLVPQRSYEQKNRCYGCHTDKIGEFAQDYIHGPVAGGACVICHDPHGSRFERNLRAPIGVLCLRCHPDTVDDTALVNHRPFEGGECTRCHDPHSTNNRWVLVQSSHLLCLGCHGDEKGEFKSHNHPFGVKPRKSSHGLRLTESGKLECLSCHDPHSTRTEHLLRTTETFTCAGCHPEHQ